MTNRDIARLLRQTADLMELQGANAFKIRAYRNAAQRIRGYDGDLAAAIRAGRKPELEGIGKGIWAALESIVQHGSFEQLDELRAEVPPGVVEMSNIPGIGPKKLRFFWKELGLTSPDELLEAAQSGALNQHKGFGPKTIAGLVNALLYYSRNRGKFHLSDALAAYEELAEQLAAAQHAKRWACTGALRRNLPVTGVLEAVVATDDGAALADELRSNGWPAEQSGKGIIELVLAEGKQARLHLCAETDFVVKRFETSTWGEHYDALAPYLGAPFGTEAALYEAAGLPWVPPPLRENEGELAAARAGKLPRLIEQADVQGIFHAHTTWSDGVHSLRQMADACRERGFSFLGISDHSKAAYYANGLDEARVRQQQAGIDQLNEEYAGFRIFKGIEADILSDGSLDYGPDFLAGQFEFVIASIHSQFRMTQAEATQRLITAVEQPATTILGHPTGRLLLNRAGYAIDHAKVIDACAANGTMIEINCNPWRLDLDWTWVPYALKKGVMIVLSPDAHSREGLDDLRYGVMVGQKGWLTPTHCLNCLDVAAAARRLEQKQPA